MSDRRYSDDEVARLLARAADLQAQTPQKTTTLDDVERIAAEAGIDPALVRRAADDAAAPSTSVAALSLTSTSTPSLTETTATAPPNEAGLFGPSRLVLEAVLDGEIDVTQHAALETVVKEGLSLRLQSSSTGRALHFHAGRERGQGGGPHISVMPRGRKTVVRVEEGLGGLMGGIWGGVGGGAGLPFALIVCGVGVGVGGDAGALVGLLGGIVGAWALTRALFVTIARAREARLRDVLAQTAQAVSATLSSSSSSLEAARARQGLLAAPVENDAVVAVEARRR